MTHNTNNINTLSGNLSRRFKGVWIPSDLWLTDELSLTEKFLLLEVDSYTDEERGYCFATNGYLAKHLQLSKTRVSSALSSLSEKGLVRIDNVLIGRITERRLFVVNQLDDCPEGPLATPATDADPSARPFLGIWIPKSIWLNDSLNLTQKAMLSEIRALQTKERGCYAGNEFFASRFDMTKKHVSDVISLLAKSGFVSVYQVRDGLRTVERRVFIKNLESSIELSGKMEGSKGGSKKQDNHCKFPESHSRFQDTHSKKPEHRESVRESDKKSGGQYAAAQLAPLEVEQEGKSLGEAQQEQASDNEFDPKSVPFEAIKDLYNEILGETLGDCMGVNAAHKKLILSSYNLRINGKYLARTGGLDFWEGLFCDALECEFLTSGKNDRNWKANFSFLIKPEKIQAFLEGAYDK
jgi:DNA-binding MarR family transcriptional regulator